MAIKFANTINPTLAYAVGSGNKSIGFFSGTQPTAAHITTNYTTGDIIRDNYLGKIEYNTFSLNTQYNTNKFNGDTSYVNLTSSNPTWSATGTGTCVYAIICPLTSFNFTTATDATMAALRFTVVPVTDSLTTGGIIRLNTVTITSGDTITITDFTFIAAGGEA